jgi:farnesyl-diphosphate farnesyltransferase
MTNILKDFWEDRSRGVCWFPQSVFTRHGVDLAHVSLDNHGAAFAAGREELIGIAHAHLRNALEYTLLIPTEEAGIRRFLLWAVGLAVLTLRKLHAHPGYTSGVEVKVTRRAVGMTRLCTDIGLRRNWMLRGLFATAARGLPLAELTEIRKIRPIADQAPAQAAEQTGTYGSVRR